MKQPQASWEICIFESGFKPGASEIGGAGYGLVQWTTQGYKTALKNYLCTSRERKRVI